MAKKTTASLGAGKIYLIAAVVAAALFAVIWFLGQSLISGPAKESALRESDQSRLIAAASLVDARFQLLATATQGFAVAAAESGLAGQTSEDWRNLFQQILPAGQRAVVFQKGRISRDQHPEYPVSFAAIEMLRAAESGAETDPVAFLTPAKQWAIQQAAALRGKNGEISGTVLTIVDGSFLVEPLKSLEGGSLALLQLVDGRETPVWQAGNGTRDAVSRAVGRNGWQVSLQGNDPSGVQDGLLSLVLLVVGALVCALGGLAVCMVLGRQAGADISALTAFASHLLGGGKDAQVKTRFPLTLHGVNLLRQQRKAVKTPAKTPAVGNLVDEEAAVAGGSQAGTQESSGQPLFNHDDALDILDSDDDLLGLSQPDDGGSSVEGYGLEEVESVDVDPGLFRAYDIRGLVDQSLTPAVVTEIGRSIGSDALSRGHSSCCVGRDGRLSSPALASALIEGLSGTGLNVIDLGMVPTPLLYFAVEHLQVGAGVMVTGSHNAAGYNGLKIVLEGQALSGEPIQALLKRIQTRSYEQGHGEVSRQDMLQAYVDAVVADIAVAAPLKVVVDAGNGVAAEVAPQLLEELGCEVIPLNCEVDGNFPAHPPDPGKPENLQGLIDRVLQEGADLGVAFDGDGDRIALVSESGKIIMPDRLLMLFAKDVVSRNPGADVLFDVKCSRNLNALISRYGGRPIMWQSGHSVMKAKMKETGALLAGELSGHIFFKERWYGFDDGVYAAARLLEILGIEEGGTDAVFSEFPDDPATPEIVVPMADEHKFTLVERLQEDPNWGGATVTTMDGVRAEFADGWGLCRASNTGPALTLRFEAESEESLARIQGFFRDKLLKQAPDLELPF